MSVLQNPKLEQHLAALHTKGDEQLEAMKVSYAERQPAEALQLLTTEIREVGRWRLEDRTALPAVRYFPGYRMTTG